jgi:hypothetical protein
MADKPLIPADDDVRQLRKWLSYDADTGVLRWRLRPSSHVASGSAAGCLASKGYRIVRLGRKNFLAHRVAWALHYGEWPVGDLDHANMDKDDNRIANLRPASRPQNNANSPSRSSRGLPKGCYKLKGRERWYSQIKIDGETKRLGYFTTAAEAATAFEQAHRVIHGEFSRCGVR